MGQPRDTEVLVDVFLAVIGHAYCLVGRVGRLDYPHGVPQSETFVAFWLHLFVILVSVLSYTFLSVQNRK